MKGEKVEKRKPKLNKQDLEVDCALAFHVQRFNRVFIKLSGPL